MQDGGGVPGITVGTVRATTTEVGLIIPMLPIFTGGFLRTGDINTETTRGKDTAGNLKGDLFRTLNATGEHGIKTDIGKNNDMVFRREICVLRLHMDTKLGNTAPLGDAD